VDLSVLYLEEPHICGKPKKSLKNIEKLWARKTRSSKDRLTLACLDRKNSVDLPVLNLAETHICGKAPLFHLITRCETKQKSEVENHRGRRQQRWQRGRTKGERRPENVRKRLDVQNTEPVESQFCVQNLYRKSGL